MVISDMKVLWKEGELIGIMGNLNFMNNLNESSSGC
jgi:hypothetical protein